MFYSWFYFRITPIHERESVCVCVHACMCACMCVCNITCKSNRSKTLSPIHADAWGNLCSTAKQKSPRINSNNNKSMPVTFLNIHRQDLHLFLMPVTNPTSKLDWTRIKQTQLAVYVSNTHDWKRDKHNLLFMFPTHL